MNSKIGNIVVKDIDDGKIDLFSLAKAHRKKKKRWRNAEILAKHKEEHIFFISMQKKIKIKILTLFPWFPQPQKPNRA
jgi:hypothetical protein